MKTGKKRHSRTAKRQSGIHLKAFSFFLLFIVLAGGVFAVAKVPILSVPKKQYLIESTGQVVKISTPSEVIKKPVAEAINLNQNKGDGEMVAGDEFARWAVLNYYPGGYNVTYPDGFQISYTPDTFQANSPSGGSVTVKISGANFIVTTNTAGLNGEQKRITEAAARLISGSFRFLSGPGYDLQAAKGRFGK